MALSAGACIGRRARSPRIFDEPLLANPLFYAVAIPAVISVGLAKGGFAGLGVLAVPLLSLVMPPVQAAAVTLPILISQDIVSVWVFRGMWDKTLTAILLAGGVVGVAIGYVFAASVSQPAVELALGAISILFALQRLWVERAGAIVAQQNAPPWVGVICGVGAGFTSQIAHAGGPPVQIYLMPRQLPRDVFLGTTTLFFAIINWIKVPAYIALGQFTPGNLTLAAVMLPLAVLSTLAGAKMARAIAGPSFYRIVYILMILLGVKLVWDGVHGLTM